MANSPSTEGSVIPTGSYKSASSFLYAAYKTAYYPAFMEMQQTVQAAVKTLRPGGKQNAKKASGDINIAVGKYVEVAEKAFHTYITELCKAYVKDQAAQRGYVLFVEKKKVAPKKAAKKKVGKK